ncbi:transcriptional regulator domain-containing protein [Mesorhizobium atlanticum]
MTPLRAGAQDWLDDETYRNTARLTRRGWAWEFLRRNAAFVGDLAVAVERVTHTELAPKLSILSLPRGLPGLAKWGLRFRQLRRGGSKRLLVSSPVRPRPAGSGNLLRRRRCD